MNAKTSTTPRTRSRTDVAESGKGFTAEKKQIAALVKKAIIQ
jgi:hypothetical protein